MYEKQDCGNMLERVITATSARAHSCHHISLRFFVAITSGDVTCPLTALLARLRRSCTGAHRSRLRSARFRRSVAPATCSQFRHDTEVTFPGHMMMTSVLHNRALRHRKRSHSLRCKDLLEGCIWDHAWSFCVRI